MIKFRPHAKLDKQAAIVLIQQEQLKKKRFNFRASPITKEILALNKANKFNADKGEIFPVVVKKRLVLLVGLGKKSDAGSSDLCATVRTALKSSYLKKINELELIANEGDEQTIRTIIEATLIGTYTWDKYITMDENKANKSPKKIWIISPPKKSFDDVIAICRGVNFTRDLVNDNADTVTSAYIEGTIRKVIKGKRKVSIAVLGKKVMEARGLNLLLAVNKGSQREPRLVIVRYNGSTKKEGYTAIVGKGVTFDTGGLNLKTTGHIESMRTDMAGAAAVIGILKNTLALNLKKNIIFAVALAENAIGPGSYKPGDVIRSYSGKTVAIRNTDAEGRLVLADAISYIVKNYKPKRIIDLATLTSSCISALGYDYTGLMSNDDSLTDKLMNSAKRTDDRAWQLPIYPELKEHIKSQIADIKNTGLRGAAGTISAAEFLHQFTGNTAWAHLDIAGTSFVGGQMRMYFGHGATGSGVRLVTDYLQNN